MTYIISVPPLTYKRELMKGLIYKTLRIREKFNYDIKNIKYNLITITVILKKQLIIPLNVIYRYIINNNNFANCRFTIEKYIFNKSLSKYYKRYIEIL